MTALEPTNKPENTNKSRFSSASGLVDLLFPPACRLCGEPVNQEKKFCHSCQLGLALSEPKMVSACPRCGRPGDINAVKSAILDSNGLNATLLSPCRLCEKEKFSFDSVVARWTYEGRVCDAIIAAKYAHQSPLGHTLGCLLGDRVLAATESDLPDVITFVPSPFRRQMMRGGRNGNAAIADGVRKRLRDNGKIVSLRELLKTTRSIKKQAWLSDTERLENVRGAFAAKKSYALFTTPRITTPRVTDQHILLVDDVLTTGATSNEVSRVLREAGARRVTLAVVARAVWSQ